MVYTQDRDWSAPAVWSKFVILKNLEIHTRLVIGMHAVSPPIINLSEILCGVLKFNDY